MCGFEEQLRLIADSSPEISRQTSVEKSGSSDQSFSSSLIDETFEKWRK
jgi:hypothetical protein